MKTTKILFALIVAAAMVACGKDDISYGNMDGTYELDNIIYLFDGKTVGEWTTPGVCNEFVYYAEKMKFEGQNVTIWEEGDWYAMPYTIDGDWISIALVPFRIKKS
ncbi:MAG: hypothetical protein ACI3ZO_07260 [Candidatus Cryptobacteroides sp.]